ncbi:hypothetical protein ACFY7C_12020 [Streptomyces sp. NPDC012769]|uniref:hypothetical protein n=1 Tax=Streptomyces sp. NPDC012769 TaxID=3364848 RepID=UPI003683D4A8
MGSQDPDERRGWRGPRSAPLSGCWPSPLRAAPWLMWLLAAASLRAAWRAPSGPRG